MNASPLWITEADVVRLMALPDAIPALEDALRLEAGGQASSMSKTMLQFGHNNLHALGGKLGDLVGTKVWTHTAGGTSPLITVWSAEDGQLAAVIEAFALGNMRTGGTSGLATDWMARPDADVMAIAGTGKQALSQVAAVLAVRPIRQVRVYGLSEASRGEFAVKVQAELKVDALPCASMQEACEGAGVVTLVTRATEPFLHASMLARGTHVNAIGSIGLDREEFAQDVFDRAGIVAVDSLHGVKNLSLEFKRRFDGGTGDRDWSRVTPLSQLIAGGQRRAAGTDLSLFKAMGMGLSDLALASRVIEEARKRGIGREMPAPKKARPRWTRAAA